MLHEKVSGCRNIKALSNLPFKPCNGSSIRERSAESLRQPEDGKSCPAATETEVCTLNKNCYHYDYNVTGICGATIQWQLWDQGFVPFTLQDRFFSFLFLSGWSCRACTENCFRLFDPDEVLLETLQLGCSVHAITPGNLFLWSFCDLLKIHADETKHEPLTICSNSGCFQKCAAAGLHEPLHV